MSSTSAGFLGACLAWVRCLSQAFAFVACFETALAQSPESLYWRICSALLPVGVVAATAGTAATRSRTRARASFARVLMGAA